MGVTKPRNRLVNFRLSEEEYQAMCTATTQSGSRSISDFARTAVLRAMNAGNVGEDTGTLLMRVNALVELLEARAAECTPPIESLHN